MLTDWVLRLRSLFKRHSVETELDDELRFHFEHLVESHMHQGVTRDEAVRMARIEFGGLDLIKEEHRDARGIRFIDDVGHDVRYALRQLRRSPGFAFVSILCLGLGIGVNTAMFGVLNSVLLRPMPVADPARLTIVNRGQGGSFSYADYQDFQARSRVLSGLAVSLPMESDLDVDGKSEFVTAEVVSATYAAVLGITPSLGRWFVDETDPVAVISYAVWQRRFNLSPDVLGRRIQSESQSYMIAGVAPRTFAGVFAPMRTDIWVPIRTRPSLAAKLEDRRGSRMMMLFGRLRAGATAAQATAELNAINTQLAAEHGARSEIATPMVVEQVHGLPNRGIRHVAQTSVTLLTAVVALVLLIACVNIGHLLLARGALRHRELALRRALGATKLRLLRQLLTESLVLAVGGGICGIPLAIWTNWLLERSLSSLPSVFPSQLDLSLDWRAVAFATATSFATAVFCGLLPAWRVSQATTLVNVQGWTRGGRPRRRPVGLIAQVVMSLVLLFVAGSFLQAFMRLQATDPGFAIANRLYAYVYIPTPPFTPDSGRAFYTRAVERLRTVPGVRRATLTDSLPLMPAGSNCASLPSGPQIRTTTSAVDIGYFETMGVHLVAGRDFKAADLSRAASTVIVTESLVRRLWPDRPALGERVVIECDATQTSVVIGVVRDSAIRVLGELAQPHVYRPFERQVLREAHGDSPGNGR